MRLLPTQIDMYNLAGVRLPFCEPTELPLAERMANARQALMQATGQDFGFDLRKWHDYLIEHHKGQYCWSNRHRSILVRIREAEADPAWREAAAALDKK